MAMKPQPTATIELGVNDRATRDLESREVLRYRSEYHPAMPRR